MTVQILLNFLTLTIETQMFLLCLRHSSQNISISGEKSNLKIIYQIFQCSGTPEWKVI